jgi:hemolysin activation/secretion protein
MKHKTIGVLLAALLLGSQASWGQAPSFTIQTFNVTGNTLLPGELVRNVLDAYTGSNRTMDDITKAVDALRSAYAAAGYPVVQVFPPEQTAADGVITLRVIEGKIAKVTVAGNKQYDEANIRNSLPALKEGTSPNAPEVVADIVLANENPAKQVAVNFQAGATAGDVDARVDVTEDRIEKTTLTYDNAGSQAAGYNRLSIAYQNANIGNLDHMLSLGINTTVEHPLDNGLNIVGGYRIPFYSYGVSLDLIGSYSNSRTTSTLPGGQGSLNFTGRGTYLGTRVNQSLPSVGEYRHKLVYGIDYKDFANEVNRVSSGTVTSTPLSIGYVAQMATPVYQAGGTITYATNLGMGLHSSLPHYNADTPGAPNQWDVWRGTAFIGLPLPEDWQFRATGNAQLTDNRLINAERFGLGGASSIRGYAERAVSGDAGYSVNIEFYTPDFGKQLMDNIKARGLFFIDHGTVRQTHNEQTGAGLPPVTLMSIGLGLRLNYGKDFALKADLGFSQTPDAFQTAGTPIAAMPARQAYGLKPNGNRWGLHLSANYTF